MYPDLSYILHALIGTNPDSTLSIIQTFGLFLGLAFMVSAFFLKKELTRKFNNQTLQKVQDIPLTLIDWLMNGIIVWVIASKSLMAILQPNEFTNDMGGFLLSKKGEWIYGSIIALILLVGQWYRTRSSNTVKNYPLVTPQSKVVDITLVAAISGIFGAKVFAIFESADTFRHFMQNPAAAFFSGSGLAIYGGLIVAFVAVAWYVRMIGIPILQMMDAVAPALVAGYGVGRLGCQLSGDGDWGIVAAAKPENLSFIPDWLWKQNYPHNVIDEGQPILDCSWLHCMQLEFGVYPTPLYECILAALIFGILWFLRKNIKVPGQLFYLYMILISVERYFIEKIRINEKIDLGFSQMTQAEIISILVFVVGLTLLARTFLIKQTNKQ